jgi:protein-tyrosine kinase
MVRIRRQAAEEVPEVQLAEVINLHEELVPVEEAVPVLEVKKAHGWVSPVYSQSRRVILDPKVCEANRCLAFVDESPEVDHYRFLRSRILEQVREPGGVTVMVTSAQPSEGKTLTAVNLSCIFAREFSQTVLLVDADLGQQAVHKVFGYASDRGLIDHLRDSTPVSELIAWPGIEKLTVMSGGGTASGGCELLGSPRMWELVQDLKGRYPERYVFFDAPPLLGNADAMRLLPLVDYVIVVVRAGATTSERIHRALKLIPQEKFLSLVLNGANGTPS